MMTWIWIFLVIFMFGMIIYGLFYAFRHSVSLLKTLSPLTGRVFSILDRIEESNIDKTEQVPAVAQPLSETAQRYEEAHTQLAELKARRRIHHIDAWNRWDSFNTPAEKD